MELQAHILKTSSLPNQGREVSPDPGKYVNSHDQHSEGLEDTDMARPTILRIPTCALICLCAFACTYLHVYMHVVSMYIDRVYA